MKKPNYLRHPLRPLRRRRHRPPPGSPPGAIRSTEGAEPPRITVLAYGPDALVDREVPDVDATRELLEHFPVVWVNFDGVDHEPTIRRAGEIFGLHRLALADVVNVPQRPKVEDYDEYLFVIARMAEAAAENATEQIALFLGSGFVLTFQERTGDPLDAVRERIRGSVGRIRTSGTDYLAYAILDAIVDHYFPAVEAVGDRLEALEDDVLLGAGGDTMARLYAVKRDLAELRRALWPTRDALNSLVRDPFPQVDPETRVYLRDTHDHVVQSIELVESYRELTSSLTDLHLSIIGTRANEIMKVLTIFAAIFIPLTFIAGIYGMNFDPGASPLNMPELEWFWGYPFALAMMAAVAVGMLAFFRRRGWLG